VNGPRSDAADTQAIQNLLGRYAELIDDGDFDGLAELFTHAVMASDLDEIEGAAAVRERFEATTRRHEDRTPRTSHVITNPIIELDGDRATCRSRYTVLQAVGSFALQPIICGRYADEFECVDREWRFTRRHYRVDLMGDLSHHLPSELVEFLGLANP